VNAVQPAPSNLTLDDHVEQELTACLSLEKPESFFLFAGAGSGKTRSLVNALKHLAKNYRETLLLRGRQVAVITFTNAACDEITRRTEYDPLFVVKTIHSFAWLQIQGLNADIRTWLKDNLRREISELQSEEGKGRAGTKASAARKAQIESKQRRLERIDATISFIYNPNGDNHERDSLNHAEVIKLFSTFLLTKPLMQRLFVEKFPFLLIDESQDTSRALIDALFTVQKAHAARFCLGLIGDTMQRIYPDGKERIENEIPAEWRKPEKKLNHRCPQRVVRLINGIRAHADGHQQVPREDSPEGWARLFVFPADSPDKPALEQRVRGFMAQITGDPKWHEINACKMLTLEHHMAARRMGFLTMFESLAPVEGFRTAFLDGSFAPTRFFAQQVLPLVSAQKKGDKFATARLIREHSSLLARETLKGHANPIEQLRSAQKAVDNLMSLWAAGEPKCGAIAEAVAASGLFALPDALKTAIATKTGFADAPDDEQADPLKEDIAALVAFLDCSFSEIAPYADYVAHLAPFDTHQGVKGLEFERVMVLMDDGDARGFMFDYDKLMGAKSISATDIKNVKEGKETGVDRTRRLFYVTCSRTRESLALVMYSANPDAVRTHVVTQGWFEDSEVLQKV